MLDQESCLKLHLKVHTLHSNFLVIICLKPIFFLHVIGEIFAGGQILNQPRGLPGKALVKNVKKDHATLASLGVKDPSQFSKPTKVDRLLGDSKLNQINEDAFFQPENGKLTFKSHLSQTERNVVRQVARGNSSCWWSSPLRNELPLLNFLGVSEELGLKLLAPTPGSRLLMKHLTRETKSEEERVKSKDEVEFERKAKLKEHQIDAKRLLSEAKKAVTVNPRLSLQSPQLGRGMARGSDFISLDINERKKAAAIQALKGKPLSRNDPNYVMKRKRTSEETEQALKKVASVLNKSTENATEELSSSDSPVEKKAKIIRSFTGEIIDEKRMEELRNKKSLNQNLVNVAELEEEEKYFAYHEKKEAMEEKMINTKEIAAK